MEIILLIILIIVAVVVFNKLEDSTVSQVAQASCIKYLSEDITEDDIAKGIKIAEAMRKRTTK